MSISPDGEPWVSPPYAALNHTFRVCTDAAGTFRPRLERQLAPLLAPQGAEVRHEYTIEDRRAPLAARYAVLDNGELVTTSPSRFVAAGTVHWLANQGAVTSADSDVVQLHAGAVQLAGRTLVLPAPMDAGKSTTVAALVRAGAAYLSDEVVELAPDGQIRRGYPKALALDRASVELLDLLDEPFPGAAHEPQWHVPADWLGAAATPVLPAVPAAVIFPRYTPGAPAELLPLTPGEATVLLAESTFRFPERSAQAMPRLTDLAARVPAYRLLIDDVVEGVRCVQVLVE